MTDLSGAPTQDLVAILDADNFTQLFSTSSPMRVSVREEKKATRFQVEDGTDRSDHVVDLAVEIAIDLIIEDQDARDGYEQIRQAWSSKRLVIVQTKVSSYDSMLIESIPHDEVPELGGAISMPIRLVQWSSVTPQYGSLPPSKVKAKGQSDTAKGGQKQTSEADGATTRKANTVYGESKKGSVLYGIFN